MLPFRTTPGQRYPFGAARDATGVNFVIVSRDATGAELLLYERADSAEPFQVITLDHETHRTYYCWHVHVEGLPDGVHYTWRLDGPDPATAPALRFNRRIELVDPWARVVTQNTWDRRRTLRATGEHVSFRAAVGAAAGTNEPWNAKADAHIEIPEKDIVIYEMHVGGFTRHPSSGVRHPGTFTGLIEKIPYLKDLGITHVELLPVMAFDEQNVPDSVAELGLRNTWGYATHSFFSPHPGYVVTAAAGTHIQEFRSMVRALHAAGIGIILDVAFNHTAEGGNEGPTINFKGLANDLAYLHDASDPRQYLDFTGCGNTVNANHPFMSRFIVDCLEYWVREMHVDGFRFDLASVLTRGVTGKPSPFAPLPWLIEFSPTLARTLLIAEAWDAAGLYQVGAFPGYRWGEWNGRFRDVIRRFVRGDGGLIGEVATRLTGSADLYQGNGRLPFNSVNFVTCHDGFTLWDLVTWEHKRNLANGQGGTDGTDDNCGWNCGHEGETDDPAILALRHRQARNLLACVLLAQGVPMLLGGDEVLRSQQGNNNTWCQDNETFWLNWSLVDRNQEMLRFTREMISLRKRHRTLRRKRFLRGESKAHDPARPNTRPEIRWHGYQLDEPLWNDANARLLAFTLTGIDQDPDLHVILNMDDRTIDAPLPDIAPRHWHLAVDTALPSPDEISPPGAQRVVKADRYPAAPRSVVVLEGC